MASQLKKSRLPVAALFIILACQRTEKEKQTAAITPEAPPSTTEKTAATLCFRQVTGRQNQDTAWVQLEIKAQQVTGKFQNLPFEKDWRRGTLIGTKNKNEISARWTFTQEGQLDSLPVQFRLVGNQLRQKPYSYIENTGREYLVDTTAYSVIFQEINCADLPQ